jgi:predicted RNase H-like HicB family nuclease
VKTDYLKFVQWSEEDQLFVGYCPDLFIGGVSHGTDEQKVYRELSRLVADEIVESHRAKHPLPKKSALVTVPVAI